ncbi:MAG: HTTM domain-containing protein, partial [Acidobacteriaceae bacterium]|nr:HTTM domain-containing protein [Acidobacteriaceae bacterium]
MSDVPPASRPANHNATKSFLTGAAVVVFLSAVVSVVISAHVQQRLYFTHAALIVIALEIVVAAILARHRVSQSVRTFFTSEGDPLNLAIFRIATFWGILHDFRLSTVRSFSQLPPGLRFAPWGMKTLLPYLPINPRLATLAGALLLASSTTGLIGCFSRISALLCVIVGLYAFGIPNFYGKVDHNHALLWFAALLAISPCGDALSVDEILTARKRADQGIVGPPARSKAYALPLRFVMLLMGVIYFFPGFWKLWQSGFDWFLADGLTSQLHLFWTWSYKAKWLPTFRIDRYPEVCVIAGAATVSFELLFIFLIFSQKLRALAALGGIAFHSATSWFLKISFLSLQVCYVALIDWSRLTERIGRAFGSQQLIFVYDEGHRSARRLAAFITVSDLCKRVRYLTEAEFKHRISGAVSPPIATEGFPAVSMLFRRIPLLVLFAPVALWSRR